MVAGATADDVDTIDEVELLARKRELFDADLLTRHAARQRVTHHARLFVDLLQHEVWIATLFRRVDVPVHMRVRGLDFTAARVKAGYALGLQHRKLPVFKHDHVARGVNDRYEVRRHVASRIGMAQHNGRILSRSHDLAGFVLAHDRNAIGAHQLPRGLHHCCKEVSLIALLDQMRCHLRVRVRREHVALLLQRIAQLLVVLDDAIVHHGDFLCAAEMRVRVALRRRAMRGPSGMADAAGPLTVFGSNGRHKLGHLAQAPDRLYFSAVEHGDSG